VIIIWIGWLFSKSHFSNLNAAKIYYLPFTKTCFEGCVASLFLGAIIYSLFLTFRYLTVFINQPSKSQGEYPLTTRHRNHFLGYSVSVVLSTFSVLILSVFVYVTKLGKLYQEITFPGTTYPAIEIRYTGGFLSSDPSLYVYILGPIYRQRILYLPSQSVSRQEMGADHHSVSPNEGTVKMAYSSFHPFELRWSKSGSKLAVLSGGNYIACYDLTTGEHIERNSSNNTELIDFFSR
jgi:hypothetical protein